MTNKITQDPEKGEWWMVELRSKVQIPAFYNGKRFKRFNEDPYESYISETYHDATPLYKMERAK